MARSASPVALFIDLHGHSVKTDHFLFGYEGGRAGKVGTRVLPWIMRETDDGFSWKKSKFNKGKNKETTGRFVVCTYAHSLSPVPADVYFHCVDVNEQLLCGQGAWRGSCIHPGVIPRRLLERRPGWLPLPDGGLPEGGRAAVRSHLENPRPRPEVSRDSNPLTRKTRTLCSLP